MFIAIGCDRQSEDKTSKVPPKNEKVTENKVENETQKQGKFKLKIEYCGG